MNESDFVALLWGGRENELSIQLIKFPHTIKFSGVNKKPPSS